MSSDVRSTAIIVFADISMTILNFLFVGYLFVDLKKQDAVHVEVDQYKQKGIEVPKLKNGGSGEPLSNNQNSALEIIVPKSGQFIIDGKNYTKSDLDETLKNLKNNTFTVSIDNNVPTRDSLYLFDILNKHSADIKVVFLEEKSNELQ